jgi:hypothetical protein
VKRLLFVVVVAVSACGPSVPAVITRTDPLLADCSFNANQSLSTGLLDVAGAGTYLLNLHLESTLPSDSTHSHDFVEDSVVAKYTIPGGFFFQPETIGMFGVLPGGGTQDVTAQLIGPMAADTLRNSVAEPMALTVHLQVKGHLSGSQSVLETDTIDFPITVSNSNTACPSGLAATGPCGNGGGQDGAVIQCL